MEDVSVRRYFMFLERSIYEGTQWVVFEPNDSRLWERIRDTIRLFCVHSGEKERSSAELKTRRSSSSATARR